MSLNLAQSIYHFLHKADISTRFDCIISSLNHFFAFAFVLSSCQAIPMVLDQYYEGIFFRIKFVEAYTPCNDEYYSCSNVTLTTVYEDYFLMLY